MANRWHFFTSKEIKPRGWLKRQLEIQAEGLFGNLDKVWPDVRDSVWIGGKAESESLFAHLDWTFAERGPYWLNGFIPLAYLLDDADMIARAREYLYKIIALQNEDGWICPCSPEKRGEHDPWAIFLITQVLTVYYDCSGDENVPEVIYRALKNFYQLLLAEKIRLKRWSAYRWQECFFAINFLYERYGEEWIVDLAKLLKGKGVDFPSLTPLWKHSVNKWRMDTHIVNVAMMMKYECVSCDILGEKYSNKAEELFRILDQYNGTPVGGFTGDECLAGLSPIQGTELCSVVDLMYSYELLYAYTGDPRWAERLELLAFNALPATISDDMWTHQYDQLSNQISCEAFPGKSVFRTNGWEELRFGLEPGYGCCTANHGQGWPKLALSAFMYAGNEVISAIPIPSEIKTDKLSVKLDTNYPFENRFSYKIEAKEAFMFTIRIPSFAENLVLDGKTITKKQELTFAVEAGECRKIDLSFETKPEMTDRPHSLKTVKCGSLVFSVPVKYKKKMYEYVRNDVERKFPYCDYDYLTDSEWSYGYADGCLTVERREVSEVPFSSEHPPVVVRANMRKIEWGLEDGYEFICAKTPKSRIPIDELEKVLLYPYGCAKLRMTEIPLLEG